MVKVFSINPEFRILRLTFHSLKMLNLDYNSFFDLFSVYLNTINHFNFKFSCTHSASGPGPTGYFSMVFEGGFGTHAISTEFSCAGLYGCLNLWILPSG